MAIHTRSVFVLISMEALARTGNPEHSLLVSSTDYSSFDSMKHEYLLVCQREISFQTADNLVELSVDAMERSLVAKRAQHHREQQVIIDNIAKLRQLAAPVEGELIDDRGLVERSTSINADEADDAEFNDLPF